jgi:MFS family permease
VFRSPRSIHYGWFIVLSGILTIIAVLGLGRFSLGMLLPSMGSDLGLSYSKMGFISTGNFIGYLAAVVVSSRLVKRFGYRTVISSGILLVGSSMIVVGAANGFWMVLVAFCCTGIGSGLANVPIMVLVSHWFGSSLRGRAAGIMVSGSGVGIMLTGVLVPFINNLAENGNGWRINWIVLGGLVLGIAALCGVLIRDHPQDLGLQILEKRNLNKKRQSSGNTIDCKPVSRERILSHLGAIYFFFGFTYVIYVTFVVTTLINDYNYTEAVAGRFWFWFGLLGIFSGPIFGSLSDRLGRAKTLALVYSLQGGAHLLLALNPWAGSIYLSIALFALCAWSVPSIVVAAIGDYLGPLQAASGFAVVTLLFGIGQITGPALAGTLAEISGSFSQAYLLAALLAAVAAVLSFFLPKATQILQE